MSQHLIDTAIRVGTCNRCGAYVFTATSSGCKVACDPAPLDAEAVCAVLAAGRGVFEQVDQAGRPWRLRRRTAASGWPPWGGRKVLGEHGCGAVGQDAEGVTEIDPKGTSVSGSVPRTSAPSGASHRSSDIWRCMSCYALIKPGELFYGIEHGVRRWARHDRECV